MIIQPVLFWLAGVVFLATMVLNIRLAIGNRNIVSTFLETERKVAKDAVEARSAIIDRFLLELREREIFAEKKHADVLDKLGMREDSVDSALSSIVGRLAIVEHEQLPRLESRIRDLEGRVDYLQHPSLRTPK